MSRFTSRIDFRFNYTNAANSAKPGYLARKFSAERKRLAEEAARKQAEAESVEAEAQRKVRRIAK